MKKILSKSMSLEISKNILQLLVDHKAQDVVGIDLANKTDLADYMLICTTSSKRQANSLNERIIEFLKEVGLLPVGVEGSENSDWILIDAHAIIINIMQQHARQHYKLEELWGAPSLFPHAPSSLMQQQN